jgi:hypothetical protein
MRPNLRDHLPLLATPVAPLTPPIARATQQKQ